MKLIRMKINRNHTSERTRYSYPKEYNAKKILFGPIYESALPENFNTVVARGDADEFILIGVADSDASGFLVSADAEEINYAKALELGNAWTKQTERISDPDKVLMICAKAARGETLTLEERKALNPKHPESGINKSRAFKDSLDEALAK